MVFGDHVRFRMNDRKSDTDVQHLAGPVFLVTAALLYNAVAVRRGRPTISAGVRWIANTKLGAEVAGAAVGLLLFHWFWKEPVGRGVRGE